MILELRDKIKDHVMGGSFIESSCTHVYTEGRGCQNSVQRGERESKIAEMLRTY